MPSSSVRVYPWTLTNFVPRLVSAMSVHPMIRLRSISGHLGGGRMFGARRLRHNKSGLHFNVHGPLRIAYVRWSSIEVVGHLRSTKLDAFVTTGPSTFSRLAMPRLYAFAVRAIVVIVIDVAMCGRVFLGVCVIRIDLHLSLL